MQQEDDPRLQWTVSACANISDNSEWQVLALQDKESQTQMSY